MDLSAHSLIAKFIKLVFLVFIVLKKPLSDPLDYKVAIPLINKLFLTLYLNRFRRKPAISKFESFSLLTTAYPNLVQYQYKFNMVIVSYSFLAKRPSCCLSPFSVTHSDHGVTLCATSPSHPLFWAGYIPSMLSYSLIFWAKYATYRMKRPVWPGYTRPLNGTFYRCK